MKSFHPKSEKFQFRVIEYHCGSIQSNFKKSPLGSYLMSCKAASYILLKWEKDFRAIGKTLNCFLCLHSLRHDSHIALELLLPSLLTYWKYCWILLNQIRHIQRHTVQEIYCFFLCFFMYIWWNGSCCASILSIWKTVNSCFRTFSIFTIQIVHLYLWHNG